MFYLKNKRVVGVVVWNLPDKIPIARKVHDITLNNPILTLNACCRRLSLDSLHPSRKIFSLQIAFHDHTSQIIREAKQHESFAQLAALFKINAPKETK